MRAAWPVMRQLRETISEAEYLVRVVAAKTQGYRLFAAISGDRIVGAMGLRISEDLAFGHHLFIDDLVVDAAERGRGYGKALLDHAATMARAAGCDLVRLTSGFPREAAHKFYEAYGMPKTGFTFRLLLKDPAKG